MIKDSTIIRESAIFKLSFWIELPLELRKLISNMIVNSIKIIIPNVIKYIDVWNNINANRDINKEIVTSNPLWTFDLLKLYSNKRARIIILFPLKYRPYKLTLTIFSPTYILLCVKSFFLYRALMYQLLLPIFFSLIFLFIEHAFLVILFKRLLIAVFLSLVLIIVIFTLGNIFFISINFLWFFILINWIYV